MSDGDQNVSWKLNELIHASRRAAYRRYESLEHSGQEQEFLPWTPTMLKLIDDRIVEVETEEGQVEDIPSSSDLEESLEPAVDEKLIPEAKMISEVQNSYQRGFDEGKIAFESELADKFLKLDKLIDGFTSAQGNLQDFHAPLVKLSLALANQLVRAELKVDSTAINELVRQSLSVIETSGEDAVVVYLSEGDLENANNSLRDKYPNVKFEMDKELSLGSLRVVMDDTSIEDFIENRLESLSSQLLRPQKELTPGFQVLEDVEEITDNHELDNQLTETSGLGISNTPDSISPIDKEIDSEEGDQIDAGVISTGLEDSSEEISKTESDVQLGSEEQVDIDRNDNVV